MFEKSRNSNSVNDVMQWALHRASSLGVDTKDIGNEFVKKERIKFNKLQERDLVLMKLQIFLDENSKLEKTLKKEKLLWLEQYNREIENNMHIKTIFDKFGTKEGLGFFEIKLINAGMDANDWMVTIGAHLLAFGIGIGFWLMAGSISGLKGLILMLIGLICMATPLLLIYTYSKEKKIKSSPESGKEVTINQDIVCIKKGEGDEVEKFYLKDVVEIEGNFVKFNLRDGDNIQNSKSSIKLHLSDRAIFFINIFHKEPWINSSKLNSNNTALDGTLIALRKELSKIESELNSLNV